MASILRRGDSYSVRFKYKDHAGRICEGWESFKTKKEAQDRKISVEKELLDGTFLIPDAMTVAEMLYKWLPIQSSKHKWAPKTYTHGSHDSESCRALSRQEADSEGSDV